MQVGLHPLKKGLKRRVFGGMPLLLLEAQSAGEIAFSRDAPGHIAPLHLQAGEGIIVREHQFLAATRNVEYDYSRIQGFANMLYGGGFLVDPFFAGDHEGVVWIHGYGNVFEKVLEPGETIDIEPGGWIFRDHSVQMTQGGLRLQDRLPRGAAATWCSTASPDPAGSVFRVPTSTRRCRRAERGNAQRAGGLWPHRRRPAGQLARWEISPGPPRRAPAAHRHRRCARPRRLPAARRRRRRRRRAARPAGVPAGRAGAGSDAPRRRHPDLAAPTTPEGRGRGWRRSPSSPRSSATCACRATGWRSSATGLRSKINVVNPATGGIVARSPTSTRAIVFGGGGSASRSCWRPCARYRPPGRRRTAEPRAAAAGAAWRWRCATTPSAESRPPSWRIGRSS